MNAMDSAAARGRTPQRAGLNLRELPSPPLVARPEDLLEGLNPEQAAAVSHGEGPLLVLAGAGSGKTRVLTRRLAWVVAHGMPQEGVVAVTFTNKAAGEMKERVGALLGTERPRSFVGTFHAWGVRLLRRFPDEAGVPKGFVVFDSDDQLAVVKRAMKEVALPEKSATPRQIQSRISQAKNEGIQPDDYPRRFGDFLGSRLADIARAYEKSLRASKALDFDDLLILSTKLVATRDAEGHRQLEPLTGGPAMPLPGIGPEDGIAAWTADGRALFVQRGGRLTAAPAVVDRYEVASGRAQPWRSFDLPAPVGDRFINVNAIVLDGDAYAYGYMRISSELYLVTLPSP